MRRIILAVTVGAALSATAACAGTEPAKPAPTAAPGAAGAAFAAAASAAAPSPSVDHTADNQKVCGELTDLFTDSRELKAFGTQLAALIVYREAGQSARAKQAQTQAQRKLRDFATALRRQTAPAKDPELKAAGEQAAGSIEKTAADNAFFAKIKSIDTVEKAMAAEMTGWLTPIATVCD